MPEGRPEGGLGHRLEKAQPPARTKPGHTTPLCHAVPLNTEGPWETTPSGILLELNKCLLFAFRPKGCSPAWTPGCRVPISLSFWDMPMSPGTCPTPSPPPHTHTDPGLPCGPAGFGSGPVTQAVLDSRPCTAKLLLCKVVCTHFSAQEPVPQAQPEEWAPRPSRGPEHRPSLAGTRYSPVAFPPECYFHHGPPSSAHVHFRAHSPVCTYLHAHQVHECTHCTCGLFQISV